MEPAFWFVLALALAGIFLILCLAIVVIAVVNVCKGTDGTDEEKKT